MAALPSELRILATRVLRRAGVHSAAEVVGRLME